MSGLKGSFKLPSLIKKRRSDHGLPTFNWSLLTDIHEIGSGAFGSIYKAKYDKKEDLVAVKRLKGESAISKDRFLKEAKLLFNSKHTNIARFLGFCDNPYSVMIKFLYFSFTPFGIEKTAIVCKVTDFGLSRSLHAQTKSVLQSRTDDVTRGTPVYMAPEENGHLVTREATDGGLSENKLQALMKKG
ncbi:G-type lectin S-receptor-like serine/threonine-protein kinase At5g35370 [Dendronephthya gigantea]|uniref:G-type lectin S-receptor-like serine/threonine-protein kinase At5g35370 n=1 Tax=Dendronephthya gigantea TaxID=151771 RepID=UPI00106BE78B|nr:G-type lectin S-receptor-like serine/threonine-protein kinase At5g35370 [Dendronephthya gigantea]